MRRIQAYLPCILDILSLVLNPIGISDFSFNGEFSVYDVGLRGCELESRGFILSPKGKGCDYHLGLGRPPACDKGRRRD
jgi:hypothetical protein